jgi:hypothetical protein
VSLLPRSDLDLDVVCLQSRWSKMIIVYGKTWRKFDSAPLTVVARSRGASVVVDLMRRVAYKGAVLSRVLTLSFPLDLLVRIAESNHLHTAVTLTSHT